MRKLYIACPYTSPEPDIQRSREAIATAVTARLAADGFCGFSPITHGHQLAVHLPPEQRSSHAFWMGQCLPMLRCCDVLVVLPLDGWRQSRGVSEELGFARDQGLPILFWQGDPKVFEPLDLDFIYAEGYAGLWYDKVSNAPSEFQSAMNRTH